MENFKKKSHKVWMKLYRGKSNVKFKVYQVCQTQ